MIAPLSRALFGAGVAALLGIGLLAGCSGGEIDIGKDDNALKNGPGSCAYDNTRYANGENFPATDGCNHCDCNNGSVICTELACAIDGGSGGGSGGGASCTYQGKTYANGTGFPAGDGCNHCSCNNGNVLCTLLACASDGGAGGGGTCTYKGQTYASGSSFPAGDGCNHCSCQPNGSVVCTLLACAIDAGAGPG